MSTLLEILSSVGDIFDDCFTIADLKAPDEQLVYVNRAFLELSGFRKEDILHKNCRFLQGNGTDQETRRRIRDSINRRESCYFDIINYRYDGTPFWNRLCLIPITHQEEVRYYVGVQQNITEKKERSLEKGLYDFLATQQASNEVARFIKNPLVNIINSSRTLAYLSTGYDIQMQEEIIQTMKEEVAKISRYVRSLP